MEFSNHITSEKGSEIIINGWKRSGIYDAVKNGSSSLPSIDPFNKIVPLVVTEKSNETDVTINQSLGLTESFVNDRYDEESDCSACGKRYRVHLHNNAHFLLLVYFLFPIIYDSFICIFQLGDKVGVFYE